MKITFSTCFYIFKSKFDFSVYSYWIDNMLSNVNNYYLVLYTDMNTLKYFSKYTENKNIKIVVKPVESFYNYKYQHEWIKNHCLNTLLNGMIEWKVNMLWSEKISFVEETVKNKYFDTEMYGWCDVGYFRNRSCDTHTNSLQFWPSNDKIETLDKSKIYYALVNNDVSFIQHLKDLVNDKNEKGLLKQQLPCGQKSIAGGFFILHKEKIEWWKNTYDAKLKLYFDNNRIVKDDQIILADCIFSQEENFCLISETSEYDNWFLFQRYLM